MTAKRVVGVEIEDARLENTWLETVQGVVIGFTPEGELVGQHDLGGLPEDQQDLIAHKMLQIGHQIIKRRLVLH